MKTPLTNLTIFFTFLKAGGLTIGSGYATIHPLHKAIVEENLWMNEEDFSDNLIMVQAIPGIFNINFATYLGHKLNGWKGSVAALIGMILPPFIILILFSIFFDDLRTIPWIEKFLRGVRPAIVALILLPCIQMWRNWSISLSTIWIPIGAAIAIGLLGVSPTYIILGLILLSLLYGFFIRE